MDPVKVTALVSNRGGIGKSSLCIQLASKAAQENPTKQVPPASFHFHSAHRLHTAGAPP